MSSGKMLTVKTSDGELFEIEEVVALQCQSLKHIIEDDCRPSTIPVQVHSKTLTKVIEYCKKHADLTLDSKDLKQFDLEFVDVDQAVLYDLLMAANFLEIKDLLDQICDQVAKMIRGRSPEEIRKTFNIENDFTPEEEEEIRRQNAWAFE